MEEKTQTYLVDGGRPAQPQTVLTDILPMVLVHSLVLPVSKEETIQRYNRVIITVLMMCNIHLPGNNIYSNIRSPLIMDPVVP